MHVYCVGTLLTNTVCRTPFLEFHIKHARRLSYGIKKSTGGMYGRKSELQRDFVQRTKAEMLVLRTLMTVHMTMALRRRNYKQRMSAAKEAVLAMKKG